MLSVEATWRNGAQATDLGRCDSGCPTSLARCVGSGFADHLKADLRVAVELGRPDRAGHGRSAVRTAAAAASLATGTQRVLSVAGWRRLHGLGPIAVIEAPTRGGASDRYPKYC